RAPRRAAIRPLAAFDGRFDELWARHATLARLVQVRDAAFLRWRFSAVPAFGYEPFEVLVDGRLEGYVVLRVLTLFDLPFGAVVDLFPCPLVDDEVTREVLSFAQRHVTERGAAFLTALLRPRHERHLRAFGFFHMPERGVGLAFREFVERARYPLLVSADMDLSVDLSFVPAALELLETHDIVVGSKKLGHQKRAWLRRFGSEFFLRIARLLL